MIVDGLAFVLVGVGLAAVVIGYERNLPDPPEQLVAVTSIWADPETTGSITPKDKGTTIKVGPGRQAKAEEVSHSSTVGRAWIDPPRRAPLARVDAN